MKNFITLTRRSHVSAVKILTKIYGVGGLLILATFSSVYCQPAELPDMTVTDGLRLWLDAATVVKNGSSKVSNWTDLSGQSNHAIQNTTNKKPLWVNDALNDQPVVRFDGSNDLLITANVNWPANHYSYFAVFKKDGNAKKAHDVFSRAIASGTGTDHFRLYSDNGITIIAADAQGTKADAQSTTLFDTTQYHLVSATRQDQLAHGTQLYVDGRFEGESGTNTGVVAVTPTNYAFFIGAWKDDRAKISLAEVLVYDKTLSETERRSVDAYLLAKYFPQQDLDADAMADWWEVLYGLNPGLDDATSDLDGDTVSNLVEFLQHRNPSIGATTDSSEVVKLKVFTPLEK